MIRPSEQAASGPAPRPGPQQHVVVGRLPAHLPVLLRSGEDGAKLRTVWGFDSYIRAANERLLRLLGWTKAELCSASYWDFVHPDDQHPLVEALDRVMGTAGRLAAYEIRVLGRDGDWRRIQWDVVADRGTERCSASARRSSLRGQPTRRRPPVGTWSWRGPGGTFSWSDELYVMFGIPVGTPLTNGLIRSRIHPRDYPLAERVWQARLADSEAHGVHFRTILPDGMHDLECTGRVVARGGGRRSRSAASRSMSRPGQRPILRPRLRAEFEGHGRTGAVDQPNASAAPWVLPIGGPALVSPLATGRCGRRMFRGRRRGLAAACVERAVSRAGGRRSPVGFQNPAGACDQRFQVAGA